MAAANCATIKAEQQKWLKLMWKTPIGTKKRRDYEKKTNAAAKRFAACNKAAKASAKDAKKGKGAMKVYGTPEALWAMEPTQRPIGVAGVVSSLLHAGFEDALLAIARGARTSVGARPADDRATIRGGLTALYASGAAGVPDPATYKSGITAKPKEDERLAKAAGASNIRDGATKIRARVIKAGLARPAWAARGIYLLENTKLISANKQLAAGILAAIPNPITMIIGASVGTHAKISKANIEKTAAEFTDIYKSWAASGASDAPAPRYAANDGGGVSASRPSGPGAESAAAAGFSGSINPWWIAGGLLVIGGAVILTSNRSAV